MSFSASKRARQSPKGLSALVLGFIVCHQLVNHIVLHRAVSHEDANFESDDAEAKSNLYWDHGSPGGSGGLTGNSSEVMPSPAVCSKDLLQIDNGTFVQDAESIAKPVVQAFSAVAPAQVSDDNLAPFQVFDDGRCEVDHGWTPGDHGCEYVKTAEDCMAAARALGLQPAPVQTDSLLAAPGLNATAIPSYRALPSMSSYSQPRGCLTGVQQNTGAEGMVVVFAAGYGTARCGMDGLSCICNCKVRRQVSNGQDLDEPEPEHVALLAAATFVFTIIMFICGQRRSM